jgi:lysyl-tRNA synthetase class 2
VSSVPAVPAGPPEDQYTLARRAKLERLRAAGVDPFPAHFHRSHTAAAVHESFAVLQGSGEEVTVAGRVIRLRLFGKAAFAVLQDVTGEIQVHLAVDRLGEEAYALFRETIDLGDVIGARGPVFLTHSGEQTVEALSWTVLAKSLRPLPEKWSGVRDVETRLRRRHVDLIANADSRRIFLQRAAIVREIRHFLDARGFVEGETPVLQARHGGALATPFRARYDALERDVYLRISLELYLKRLLVGGIDKVYEIGRVFRNEGLSRQHSPEFTLLESYEAYTDYTDVMRMVEELIPTLARNVLGSQQITVRGQQVDLTPPWPRQTLRDAIREGAGVDYAAHPTLPDLEAAVREAGLRIEPQKTRAQLIDKLLDHVAATTVQPVFFLDYPVELSPLAKLKPGSTDTVERFEAFAAGIELGNAFSELNDPDDQFRRFLDQVSQAAAGDADAHVMDVEFVEALQYGMPPAGGLGIGIDRLTMFLLDVPTIREVIAFPMLRDAEGQ